MTQRQADNLDAVRAWIFPTLLAIIGFLIVFVMNQTMNYLKGIESKQRTMQDEFRAAIEDIRTNQRVSQYQMQSFQQTQQEVQEDINDLKKKLTIK